jgi:hypothetical protein
VKPCPLLTRKAQEKSVTGESIFIEKKAPGLLKPARQFFSGAE